MKIEVEHHEDWTVLFLSGDLHTETGSGVYLQFQRELFQGRKRFVFDLDGVKLMDSSGLGVLVRCYRDARTRGGEIRLQRVPTTVQRILEFTRLDTIFPIAPGAIFETDAVTEDGQDRKAS